MKPLNLKIFILYLVTFILLFTPDFGHLSFVLNPSVIILITACFFSLYLNKKIVRFILKNRLLLLFAAIICASFLSMYRSVLGGQSVDLILYICFILQFINVISIIIILRDNGYDTKRLYGFIINIFIAQAVIIVLMCLFPGLKNIANNLYFTNLHVKDITPFLGIEEFRIYGITGDYTYATPVAMAYVAVVCMVLAIFYNEKKYYLFFVLLILTSLLNGRTGFMLAFLAALFTVLAYFVNHVYRFNRLLLLVLFFGVFVSAFMLIFITINDSVWAVWVRSGFLEIKNLFMNQEKSGNLTELLDNMIFFPEGWYLLFGHGRSVFVEDIGFMKGRHSDIGYINDLFRGGLLYIAVLYLPVYHFLLRKTSFCINKIQKQAAGILRYVSFLFIILANYKGECMNSNAIFNTILYVCIVSNTVSSGLVGAPEERKQL